MSEINVAARDAFLAELTDLSRRHGIWIAGCGCCGSPYLTDKATAAYGSKELSNESAEYHMEVDPLDNLSLRERAQ